VLEAVQVCLEVQAVFRVVSEQREFRLGEVFDLGDREEVLQQALHEAVEELFLGVGEHAG